ncbi:MAG: Trans-aconitate 2-methyltransferase [Nitrospirae bacterium]|nr:MAG: Demethylrebeccamycin-D-glucose O-methyltransferase [Nitrospira sp. OLB3]MBV6468671.1 Trans-aconitate 2-methyltransferase [Nitrospirota bacterium]MCE7964007.1 methyltransferase domain-containing protein [Nitrospira sp. NTP2]MCK6492802.1 methyltransferase domain-containing protein [Nitrospira sp.]MEB2337144.1 methyltransferase domain-containing protein [Nitrospirales bacterium]
MKRELEAELMDDADQARAYAQADFAEENQGFVNRFREYFPDWSGGHAVDLGCGPADIPIRFARAFPDARVTAVDASRPMLDLAARAVAEAGLTHRIALCCERLQTLQLPEAADVLLSNSLLHHLPNPLQFWVRLRQLAKPGACILVMDLLRPESPEAARAIVQQYTADEDPILQRDFYHSLLAAFTEDEVAGQLAHMNLSRLLIDVPDDRHWVVGGIIP